MLEKVLGVEGSTAAAWAGRACAGVDGERSESTLSIPGGSLVIEGFFSQHTLYQRLNLSVNLVSGK